MLSQTYRHPPQNKDIQKTRALISFILACFRVFMCPIILTRSEVGIYKRKQDNTISPKKAIKKKSKKTRSRPRKRSRKKARKHAPDQESDQENKKTLSFFLDRYLGRFLGVFFLFSYFLVL